MANAKRTKVAIDIVMSVLLLFLMAYQVTGELWHEWCGTAMVILFIIHNILNQKWYAALFRGKYTPIRIFMTVVNLACFVTMICLMISGIMMSRHVFAWLPIDGGMSLARMMHMSASYLGFVFMSLHIGLHWRMVMAALGKKFADNRILVTILRILAAFGAVYGLYTFVQARLWRYMFLQEMFVFMDFEKAAVLVLLENLSMMVFWAVIAYYGMKLLTKRKQSDRKHVAERNQNETI